MTARAPAVGALLGHYRIVEKVGKGGMGVVFRAWDERLEREVAVKVLPPGTFPDERARRRFQHEAHVLAKLNHPNIVMAFDFAQQDGIDYLVTEYVAGVTMDVKLASGALSQKQVVELGVQLAKGLFAAHRANIIHRDLKPGNLRLTGEGELKILDFGLARWREPVSELSATASLNEKDAITGTLPYMAPEQIRCEEADVRTDIWATGAILYEMATGKRPFPMASPLKLIDAIQHFDPPAPSTLNRQLTPQLDTVITKALDKNPDRRYQSASELRVDLLRLSPVTTPSGRLSLSEFAIAHRVARPTWIALAVAVACAIIGFALRESLIRSPQKQHKLLTVLPFDSSGQDEKTGALISGLTETVSARLAQQWGQNLQLISARDVRDQGVETVEQAWKDFGSDLVLVGDAHRVGNQIRINSSLVDARTHRQLMARTITADMQDIFGLEDQVADAIASLLDDEVRTSVVPVPRTQNKPAAYASYLRARGYLSDYQKAENIELAVAELKSAVAFDPDYANAYAELGEAYLIGYEQVNRGGDWVALAQQNCRKSVSLRETAEGHICLGLVYNQIGKYQLAVPEFERAVQIDQSNEDGLRGLADAYGKLGNAIGAEAAYRKAIALRPNYWGVHSRLGAFYYNQARYVDAIAQFQEVVKLAPNNYRGYSNLGGLLVAVGRYKEALEPLNRSIDIGPNLEAFNNLGNAYFDLHRFGDAAEAFQRGLNLDDSDWLLWGNLGDSLYWSGAKKNAIEAYEKAISRAEKRLAVNPMDSDVFAFSASYNAMAGHKEAARNQIEKALALAPSEAEVRMRAALVYNQLGELDHCLSSLEKAVALGYARQLIRDTPDFDHLHGNARFKKLAQIT
jgi:serine/threonine protein kinase/tetratricopeptide (TPR) repeat protein